MKERPILMSAPMVLRTLDGSKTQTRRKTGFPDNARGVSDLDLAHRVCPYGQVGDRLWVRETFKCADASEGELCYLADLSTKRFISDEGGGWWSGRSSDSAWTPSIHMPRWASRLTLEVTGVRVERLNSISEADARAEGATCPAIPLYPEDCGCFALPDEVEHRHHFRLLWESITGPGSWAANPWVWVISFKRVIP